MPVSRIPLFLFRPPQRKKVIFHLWTDATETTRRSKKWVFLPPFLLEPASASVRPFSVVLYSWISHAAGGRTYGWTKGWME